MKRIKATWMTAPTSAGFIHSSNCMERINRPEVEMNSVHLHEYPTHSNCNNQDLELSGFEIDASFLRSLTFQGAERRYGLPLSMTKPHIDSMNLEILSGYSHLIPMT